MHSNALLFPLSSLPSRPSRSDTIEKEGRPSIPLTPSLCGAVLAQITASGRVQRRGINTCGGEKEEEERKKSICHRRIFAAPKHDDVPLRIGEGEDRVPFSRLRRANYPPAEAAA